MTRPPLDSTLPSPWAQRADEVLEPDEQVRAWLTPDLTRHLAYAAGCLVLTDRRLFGWEPVPVDELSPPANESAVAAGPQFRHWQLSADLELRFTEQSGVGKLALTNTKSQLAVWRFTAKCSPAARNLLDRFQAWKHPEPKEEPIGDMVDLAAPPESEDDLGKPKSLFRLVRFAKPHAGLAILGFSLMVLSTAASLVPPYLTMPLLDDVLIPRQSGKDVSFNLVLLYLAGLAGAALVAWLLNWARIYVMAWVSEKIAAELRNQTYEHLQKLSIEFFSANRTGDLMSRVGSDTDRINIFLSVNALDFITDIVMISMTAVILISIHPWLAIVTLLPFPAIAMLIQMVRFRLRRGFDRGNRAWAELVSVLADTIPGIRVVKAFAQERREIERFRKANDFVFEINNQVNRVWSFFGPMITLLTETGLLVVWAFGAWWVFQSTLTVGVLTAFLAFITRFYTRLESMSRMVAAAQRAAAATDRIFDILDRVPKVPEPIKPVHVERIEGAIEIRGLKFGYGKRRILNGIDLSVAPGEMIGLVGPSGAGKSTLINLVCRFYDVEEGSILVDGIDIRRYPIDEYRRNIGLVLQEPFLFYGSVAENIAYGKPEATRDEIVAAARAAKAHEFILRLADGYDSMVGERGQSLSGGERQRISIARALLINPRILIMDEATSSVDTETERDIQAALENLIQGRTTLAIAHRLSTLRRADRLVVVEQGLVSEVGPHDELLARGGTYSRLYHAQQELAENAIL